MTSAWWPETAEQAHVPPGVMILYGSGPAPDPGYADGQWVFIHKLATVHPTATLGARVRIFQGASVMAGAIIGDDSVCGPCSFVGVNARCGNNVRLQHGAYVVDHATVGNNVFVAHGVVMANDRHPRAGQSYKREDVVIEDGVSIGAGAVILPGVRLGAFCEVGAGAVVTRDVPPNTAVVGNPARTVIDVREDRQVTVLMKRVVKSVMETS